MSRIFTYSFEDTTVVLYHPSVGSFTAYGEGLNEVVVARANDSTTHEPSADGSVLVNKIIKQNGTITLSVLRASEFEAWLNRLVKYLESAPVSEYALLEITVRNASVGESWLGTGCSHQKMPDAPFKAQADYRSWVFMAADLKLQ